MPKQVFLVRCELVVARVSPPKSPKCLENGLFWDKKCVKTGRPHLDSWEPESKKKGGGQKWVKNGFSQKCS